MHTECNSSQEYCIQLVKFSNFKSGDLYIKYMCKFKKYSNILFFFLITFNLEVKSLHRQKKKIIICVSLFSYSRCHFQSSWRLYILVSFFNQMWSIFHYLHSRRKFQKFVSLMGAKKIYDTVPKKKWIFTMQKTLISVMTLYWRARSRNFEMMILFCQKAEQPSGLLEDIQSPLLLSFPIGAKASAVSHRNGKCSHYYFTIV